MYINFWYPVAASDEVTNEAPLRVRMLCLDFVAFRDTNGQPHVLSDTCIHRGAALGEGKVVGDHVQCPYHGWQYDGTGQCVKIPTLPDEKPPGRAAVDSYPVQEKYGIVFAFLGDLPENERPPLWDIEEYDADDWRPNILKVFEVDYYYERSIENALDPAHNEFVHPKQGAPGMLLDFKKTPIEMDAIGDWGSGFMIPFTQLDPEGGLLAQANQPNDEVVKAGSGYFGPNAVVTWLHFTTENMFHQYFFEAPIDENRTRIFFINMRHFMMDPKHDQQIVDINMEIAQEDIDLMVKLNPVRTPETTTKELLVPSDEPVVHFRKALKGWEARGWRLDMKKINELRGDVAMAIPSPARRERKSWVLDTAPLMKNSD
jgi:phenylpropionate dioxygenase-like ring-hydroxylating dioxygenase large terminal subunit